MRPLKSHNAQIEKLGKELLATAEQLLEMTSQVFSGEELIALQQKQEKLVDKLIELDGEMEEGERLSHAVVTCLDSFQKLNNAFVENVKQSKGIIQFETAGMERMHEAVMAIKNKGKKLKAKGKNSESESEF